MKYREFADAMREQAVTDGMGRVVVSRTLWDIIANLVDYGRENEVIPDEVSGIRAIGQGTNQE